MRGNGLRLLVEMGLIVAVAAIAGALHRGAWTIVAAVVVVWVVISVFEYARAHLSERRPARLREPAPIPDPIESLERVRVLPATPRVEPEPEQVAAEPASAPSHQVQEGRPETQPEPVPDPQPVPDPGGEREPAAVPGTAAMPGAEAEDEPDPEPAREPVQVAAAPWSWNVWNLERVARERASTNEELGYLLLYLRDFANPAGMLPPDFDGLVRESFGDLLAAPA